LYRTNERTDKRPAKCGLVLESDITVNIVNVAYKSFLDVTLSHNSMSVTTSCAGGRHNMPPPHASWPLTFWPWKWCPSHVWRGLPLCRL